MARQTDAAAHAAAQIDGLVLRPYAGPDDVPVVRRLMNAEWAADDVRGRISDDELRAELGRPSAQLDPARDLRVAEVDGVPVAVAWSDWVDAHDGVREYRSRGWVDPAWRRRGIGTRLLADATRRARELAATHETDRPRMLGAFSAEGNAGAQALLRDAGYAEVRWFFDMERPIDGELPPIEPLPAPLEVRPVTADDARAIWQADHDAFQDHWGGFDDSEEAFERWFGSPELQPERFVVAFDGDEIAAAVLNVVYPEENAELGLQRGWLDSVFTRRPWRRRGLARNLIVRSLHLLREQGMTSAALGVDAENGQGALGLYESAGFVVTERSTAWRRPLEAGS